MRNGIVRVQQPAQRRAFSYVSTTRFAADCHQYFVTRCAPFSISRFLTASLSNIVFMPREISNTFSGLTSRAASSSTSGSEDVLEASTAVPLAMASSGGKPKPSYKDGNANNAADL